jgi:monoterpene epsilon-lactone hydrolase
MTGTPKDQSLTIDTHHHILPGFFWQETENAHAPVGGLAPLPWSKEATISFMDDAGIDIAVVSLSSPGVHTGDSAKARALARRCNEFSAELVRSRPNRFGGFACLALPDVDASLEELSYAAVAGISGWWAKPARTRKGAAIIHVHGGWFNWGTAQAFRNFAGHIALSAGTDAFIPDYRLAPEHPFPVAVRDLETCYRGLVDQGITKIALTGDSAGGNLALVLLSIASAQASKGAVAPVGAVVFSPITDLALTGASFDTRAEADLYFTKSQAAGLVRSYLGVTDPKNPLASPLYADLSGLPPIRVHVGDEEVLLDDSRRYVENAVAAGVDAKLDLWMGMPHGFVTNVGGFNAASQALRASGAFLTGRLGSTAR